MPLDEARARAFILAQTALASPPLLPELRLHLATEVTPLWHATERELAARGVEPPFWAFAWAGGQALARHVLDDPSLVRGRAVLDLASGSGLCAIAAAKAGAGRVVAVDRDPLAGVAVDLNAAASGVDIEARVADPLGGDAMGETPWIDEFDVVLAGDVCYDREMAPRAIAFLRARARAGALVLLGDPGRHYLPEEGLAEIARHRVPTLDDVEAEAEKWGVVYRITGAPPPR